MRRLLLWVLIMTVLVANFSFPSQTVNAQVDAPSAPDETPTAMVSSGVTSYTLAAPKIFWHTGVPICPPTAPEAVESPLVTYPETIKRVARYGSQNRTLYEQQQNCSTGQILSNLAADQDFIYFFNPTGLMKLSTLANPGDAPQIMNALVDAPGEVVDGGDRVFYIAQNTAGNTQVGYVLKSNNARVNFAFPTSTASNLSYDGQFAYYITAGNLYRYNPSTAQLVLVTNGVTGYYAEGRRLLFCTISPPNCFYTDTIFIAKGRFIYTFNNETDTLNTTAIYTSIDTTARIEEMVSDGSHLFFFERRTIPCSPQPCFSQYNYLLQRTTRSGASLSSLHIIGPTLSTGPVNLSTTDGFLFWDEAGKLNRLPNDVEALPVINMSMTGMEITQGIQSLDNSVLLIKGRRTFVRVYVKSDGNAVSGVTAQLYAPSLGLGPLNPVNPKGTKITVRNFPNRSAIEESFLFELPWSWIQGNSLTLRADLNPYKVPLEPNYTDNSITRTVSLVDSPNLSVEFFSLNYTIGNETFIPRFEEDFLYTYSWIQRAYPIGGAIGDKFKPRIWDVDGGEYLGTLVMRIHDVCSLIYDDPDDDISLCASYVTNSWLWNYRINTMLGKLNIGLSPTAFYYGMISDAAGYFPRGQARFPFTSVGPAGESGGWDTDGTYADWYAAHEIGHSLGRAHPASGSDNPNTEDIFELCRHSRSDMNYPYGSINTASAPIGPADKSIFGFDVGDAALGLAPAVLPSDIWNDVMSYCNNQWLSDYTYTAMYNFMMANPSMATKPLVNEEAQAGDWLAVSGVIDPDDNQAAFGLVQRLDNVINTPIITPGTYRLRLLDAANLELSSQDFSTDLLGEDPIESFALVVPFASGARSVAISAVRTGEVLATYGISANPPVISNVTLQAAPNPVIGEVTLNWIASDPDLDLLTFDILYSTDGGATFQPVKAGVNEQTTQIDTANLGGSSNGVFRVIASDGVHTAYADSAPFNMLNKSPTPIILNPSEGHTVNYGQLINFSGMAIDALDGTVAASGLQWLNDQQEVLGNGPLFSSDTLPVGMNVITLRATNSQGLVEDATIGVYVGDDLNLPGPTLTASPDKVGWHVPSGETAVQQYTVSINNSGSGSLNWNASDNAPWLSLSASSGSVTTGDSSVLVLTADPSGLADNTTHQATLTITKPASGSVPAQTVEILVVLSIGDVWSGPPAVAPSLERLFLPILIR